MYDENYMHIGNNFMYNLCMYGCMCVYIYLYIHIQFKKSQSTVDAQ